MTYTTHTAHSTHKAHKTCTSRAKKAFGGLATAALLLTGATPATAQDPSQGDWLSLTVTRGDTRSGDTPGTLLRCDPPQGHARAAEACAQLAAVNGDIGAIALKKDVFCTMVYAPVTARARGEWGGRSVEFEKTYANACVMEAWTGAVFALDERQGRVGGGGKGQRPAHYAARSRA
ncbi:SSI family serine proteinase inhibitor [Streptomyces sp. NPDC001315]|uniref:SSI family serine proteinase inhibitor n=1 Tax=Streptomyces sp. NPDC001315 TaxID=3364562 RepID=UPI003681DD9B